MKSTCLLRLFLAGVTSVALAAALPAADAANHTIKFSEPYRPGTLKIQVGRGDVRIKGADTAEVSVESEARPAATGARRDGLRVLSSSSGFTLTEKDNVVTLESSGEGHGTRADFAVNIPRQTNLVVENSWGGKIHVAGVSGDIEITGMNGEVTLDGIGGGAVVQTMNGEINATIAQLKEDRPLSFTSMNGPVQIRLPADAKANVRLRTHNGAILTDFEEGALVTKVESTGRAGLRAMSHASTPRAPRAGVLPPEAQEAIREASRAAVEATRHAAQALREAAEAAREGAESARPAEAPRAPRAARAPHAPVVAPATPIPPMTGGKLVSGTLNGGGSEINVATMNGDVTLRKVAAGK